MDAPAGGGESGEFFQEAVEHERERGGKKLGLEEREAGEDEENGGQRTGFRVIDVAASFGEIYHCVLDTKHGGRGDATKLAGCDNLPSLCIYSQYRIHRQA